MGANKFYQSKGHTAMTTKTQQTTVEQRKAAIVADLRRWQQETGERLPMPAEAIADLEIAGDYVDLRTGRVIRAEVQP